MVAPIVNPELPYNGEIPDGLTPGKMIRIQGVTHPDADRFNINLQTGPEAKPRDDTALHISVRLNQGYIARNTYVDGVWGDEEGKGSLPIGQAQSFEIIVLVDPSHFKVAVNGQHFCEFTHKIPFEKVTHLLIDGQVSITLISYEGAADTISQAARSSELNAEGPQVPPQYGPGGYGPPPGNYGPPQQGYGPPPYAGGYGPPPPPGAPQESGGFNSFLSQAQDVLAGAISSGAAEKILGGLLSGGGSNQQPQGYAHQNARYGVYPQLPNEENSNLPTNNKNINQPTQNVTQPQAVGPFESLLTNMLAGNKTVKSDHPESQNQQQNAGVLENLLAGFLASNQQNVNQQSQNQTPQGAVDPQNVHPQSGVLQNLLTGLLSNANQGNDQNKPTAQNFNQNPGAQGVGDQQSGVLQNILAGLVSNTGNQQHDDQKQPVAQNLNQNPGTQGVGDQHQSGILQNILSGLVSNTANQGQVDPNKPPTTQSSTQQQTPNNSQLLLNMLSGLLVSGAATRPLIENPNVGGQSQNHDVGPKVGGQELPQQPQQGGIYPQLPTDNDVARQPSNSQPTAGHQQYGQYPHPQGQEQQRGPMESLLSGFLGGGSNQQHGYQQPHVPQVGGEGSVGGLGSMGSILSSLAGQILQNPRDGNQRPNY